MIGITIKPSRFELGIAQSIAESILQTLNKTYEVTNTSVENKLSLL